MKKVVFKDFKVNVASGEVKVTATINTEESENFNANEIKKIVAAVLHNITNIGDMNGFPITENVTVNGVNVIGHQRF